jgi:hypothetical protein
MTHWLEEAEAKIHHRKDKKLEIKDRIDTKKEDVKINRDLIENEYLDLIDQMVSIIQRINNLPRHNRMPFGQIYAKQKENKLDNLLHKFHSSRRVVSKEFASIWKPFKEQHYKNTRSFFISIGRQQGEVLLEYKDIKVKRVRLNDDAKGLWNKIRLINIFKKKKEIHDVKENIVNIPIKDFNKELTFQHIDWLAFKSDGESLFKE